MLTQLVVALACWLALTAVVGCALADLGHAIPPSHNTFTARNRTFQRVPLHNLRRLHGRHRA